METNKASTMHLFYYTNRRRNDPCYDMFNFTLLSFGLLGYNQSFRDHLARLKAPNEKSPTHDNRIVKEVVLCS